MSDVKSHNSLENKQSKNMAEEPWPTQPVSCPTTFKMWLIEGDSQKTLVTPEDDLKQVEITWVK